MEPRDIDFVAYGVSSLEKALPFYRDTLGLKPLGEPFDGKWQEFSVGKSTLAIAAPPWGQPPSEGARGGATVAIAVPDLKAALKELEAKGVPVVRGIEESPVCWLATIKDPDGNAITLHQRKDGTAG